MNSFKDKHITFILYVPASSSVPIAHSIAPGSAIIGGADTLFSDVITIDYEGNIYGAVNMLTLADRAAHAADRQAVRYPTVARCTVPRTHLMPVGVFDYTNGILVVNDEEARGALARWLGVEHIEESELHMSH